MSSIDNPEMIRKLIERKGREPGIIYKGMRSIDDPRRDAYQIWGYITGFGGPCYKIIYGMYQNRMNDEEAAARFVATANIKPGTTPTCLFRDQKLTEAGRLWWIGMWGEDSLPKG